MGSDVEEYEDGKFYFKVVLTYFSIYQEKHFINMKMKLERKIKSIKYFKTKMRKGKKGQKDFHEYFLPMNSLIID